MSTGTNKLQGKDLINVGIFSAIYLFMTMAASFLNVMPFLQPFLSVIIPIIGSIPFMLYLTKVKKFGMVVIMGIILGLVMMSTGMGYYAIVFGAICGLIAEIIIKSGNYSSVNRSVFACGVFSMWIMGNFLPVFVARESYYQMVVKGYGREFADAIISYMPPWIAPILLVACFVSGLIGGCIGKSLLKKHFQRAGIV